MRRATQLFSFTYTKKVLLAASPFFFPRLREINFLFPLKTVESVALFQYLC